MRTLTVHALSESPAWGWTTLAMVLTNSWFGPETGEIGLWWTLRGRTAGRSRPQTRSPGLSHPGQDTPPGILGWIGFAAWAGRSM